MTLDLDLGQWIVIALSAFLLAWYYIAGSLNRQRGIALNRWLYRCLQEVGKITSRELIRPADRGARLVVKKASGPFRSIEAFYLLEPLEFLPYWLFRYLQGKRDEVWIKVTLLAAPRVTWEVKRALSTRPHPADPTLAPEPLPQEFEITSEGQIDQRLLDGLGAFLREHGATVHQVSLRRDAPHLLIRASAKPLVRSSAENYLVAIQAWF